MDDACRAFAEIPVSADDGHHWRLQSCVPAETTSALLWLPALGTAARHYLPFAQSLAARGVAVFVHEWRGHGSSSVRASREHDWGYRELLMRDLPASEAAVAAALPGLTRILGGHSLGGQLACCRVALDPHAAQSLWLVGSGSPYWRAFPVPTRFALPLAYRLLPWLANRHGALPGRRIGFGGSEARGVIADWARTAMTGRYAASGVAEDLEAGLAGVTASARGVVFDRDWLAPRPSLDFLLSKMPLSQPRVTVLDAAALGSHADHFAWMKHPRRVVATLLE